MTTERQRMDHIEFMWRNGHKGSVDRAKRARNVEFFGSFTPGIYPSSSNKLDFDKLDMPIQDIHVFKDKTGKNVYVGGSDKKRRNTLTKAVQNVITHSFAASELKKMSLYFDTSHPSQANAAGECQTFTFHRGEKREKKHSIIRVAKGCEKEDVLIHEMVHARRHVMGDNVRDIDREEKETELEAVIRMQSPKQKVAGYYQLIPGGRNKGKMLEMILSDRVLATGSEKKSLKGKRAVKRTQEIYDKSFISTVHFSPAEDVDGYFEIRLPDGIMVDLHVRYTKRPSLTQIKKDLKKRYGTNITAWEYRDGKRVQIIKKRKKPATAKKGKKRGKKKK